MSLSLEKSIKKHGCVFYPITGTSMYPMLIENSDRVLLTKPNDIKLFDIVLFKRRNNRYVLHRIVDIKENTYTLIGDNSTNVDVIKKKDIIAKLDKIYRNEKEIEISTNSCIYVDDKNRFLLLENSQLFFTNRQKEAYYELIKLVTFGKYDSSKITCLTKCELYNLAKLTNEKKALHLLGFAIDKFNLKIDEEISKAILEEYHSCLIRNISYDSAIDSISKLLSKYKIKHIFLKGSEYKKRYKYPYLRTSNDLDVYVSKTDFCIAKQLLLTSFNGRINNVTSNHDESLILEDLNLMLDLHHDISTNLPEDLMYLLKDPFNNAKQDECYLYRYYLSNKDMTLFFLSHNAKHINIGDFWYFCIVDYFYLNKSFDNEIITIARLNKFNHHYENIINHIYNDTKLDDLDKKFEDTLFLNHYDLELSVAIARENRIKYVLDRIFPSFNALSNKYKILKKIPILYPFIDIYRLIYIFIHRSFRSKREVEIFRNSSKDLISTLKSIGLEEYIVNPKDHETRF